jgi:membrane-associated phospholipid phosphatase
MVYMGLYLAASEYPIPALMTPHMLPHLPSIKNSTLTRAEMRLSNRRGYTWKSWLLLIPLSSASLISISRTMDYRHHATDVIAGAIIGIVMAWYSYRQYYPVSELVCPHLTSLDRSRHPA